MCMNMKKHHSFERSFHSATKNGNGYCESESCNRGRDQNLSSSHNFPTTSISTPASIANKDCVRNDSPCISICYSPQEESDSIDYVAKRRYDLASWRMYNRITKARKIRAQSRPQHYDRTSRNKSSGNSMFKADHSCSKSITDEFFFVERPFEPQRIEDRFLDGEEEEDIFTLEI